MSITKHKCTKRYCLNTVGKSHFQPRYCNQRISGGCGWVEEKKYGEMRLEILSVHSQSSKALEVAE